MPKVRRRHTLRVRLSDEEHAKLQRLAGVQPVSTYVRIVLLGDPAQAALVSTSGESLLAPASDSAARHISAGFGTGKTSMVGKVLGDFLHEVAIWEAKNSPRLPQSISSEASPGISTQGSDTQAYPLTAVVVREVVD